MFYLVEITDSPHSILLYEISDVLVLPIEELQ